MSDDQRAAVDAVDAAEEGTTGAFGTALENLLVAFEAGDDHCVAELGLDLLKEGIAHPSLILLTLVSLERQGEEGPSEALGQPEASDGDVVGRWLARLRAGPEDELPDLGPESGAEQRQEVFYAAAGRLGRDEREAATKLLDALRAAVDSAEDACVEDRLVESEWRRARESWRYGDLHSLQARLDDGEAHCTAGRIDFGLESVQGAIADGERQLPAAHPWLAHAETALAHLLVRLGRPVDARPYYEAVLRRRRRAYGERHEAVAKSHGQLAQMLWLARRPEPGLRHAEAALAIRRALWPADHPRLADALGVLAAVYQSMGDFQAALSPAGEALEIRRRRLGDEDLLTALSHNDVGTLHSQLGEVDRSLPHLEKALEIRREKLGERHRDTLQSMGNLASNQLEAGDAESARETYEAVLAARREVLPPDHPDLAITLTNLGLCRLRTGDAAAAVEACQEALDLRLRVLGPQHPQTLASRQNLAMALIENGDPEPAESHFERIVELQKRLHGATDARTAFSLCQLGDLRLARGQTAPAREAYRQAMAAYRSSLGPRHARTLEMARRLYMPAAPEELSLFHAMDAFVDGRDHDGFRMAGRLLERERGPEPFLLMLLCLRRLADREADEEAPGLIDELLARQEGDPWMRALIRMIFGRSTPDELLAEARTEHQETQAFFYVALELQREGKDEEAGSYFERAEASPLGLMESELARRLRDGADPVQDSEQAADRAMKNHVRTLIGTVNRLAGAERLDEAKESAQSACQAARDLLGEDSLEYAQTLNNLAGLHTQCHELEIAEPLFRIALDVEKRTGAAEREIASTLHNLANLLRMAGRSEEALEAIREVVEIKRRALPEKHPSLARSVSSLATLEGELENPQVALELFEEVRQMWRDLYDHPHPDAAFNLWNLAALHRRQGRPAEAKAALKEAVDLRRELFGTGDPRTLELQAELAELHLELGEAETARPLFEQTLEALEAAGATDHRAHRVATRGLGMLDLQAGRHQEAAPNLLRAFAEPDGSLQDARQEHVEAYSGARWALLQSLRNFYRSIGDEEIAGRFESEAAAAPRTSPGPPELRGSDPYSELYWFLAGDDDLFIESAAPRILFDGQPSSCLMLYLALERRGSEQAEILLPPLAQYVRRRWSPHPHPLALLALVTGDASFDAIREEVEDDNARCQAHFYAGARLLLDGDRRGAEEHFAACAELDATCPERLLAAQPFAVGKASGPLPELAVCAFHAMRFEAAHAGGRHEEALTTAQAAHEIADRLLSPKDPLFGVSLHNLALALQHNDLFDESAAVYERLIRVRRDIHGADDPEYASSLDNLAVLHLQRGDAAAAEPLCREAVEIHRAIGEDRRDVAIALSNLSTVCSMLGRPEEAEEHCRGSLDICLRLFGERDVDTATAYLKLSGLLRARGERLEAAEAADRCHAIRSQVLDAHHPEARQARDAYVELSIEIGRLDQAEAALRRALEIAASQPLPGAAEEGALCRVLGDLLRRLGRREEAREWLEKAVALHRSRLGRHHPETCRSEHRLGTWFYGEGHLERACRLHDEAFYKERTLLGAERQAPHVFAFQSGDLPAAVQAALARMPTSPDLLTFWILYVSVILLGDRQVLDGMRSNLPDEARDGSELGHDDMLLPVLFGQIDAGEAGERRDEKERAQLLFVETGELLRRGELEAALAALETAFNLMPESPEAACAHSLWANLRLRLDEDAGPQSPADWMRLALAAAREGRSDVALAAGHRALEQVIDKDGAGSPGHLSMLSNLALILQWLGRGEEAEERYRECLLLHEEAGEADTGGYAVTLNNLSGLLHSMGRLDDALALAERGLEIKRSLERRDPENRDPVSIATSLVGMARIYQDQGRFGEAEPLFLEAVELDRRRQTEVDADMAGGERNLAVLYQSMGRLAEASERFARAGQLLEQAVGEKHPLYLQNLNERVRHENRRHQVDEARRLARKAVELSGELFGEEHSAYAYALARLAETQDRARGVHQAGVLYGRALEILEGAGEVEPMERAQCLSEAAIFFARVGEADRAEQLVERSLEVVETVLPDQGASLLSRLGVLQVDLGRVEAGRAHLERAFELQRQALPRDPTSFSQSAAHLAQWHLSQGRLREAEQLFDLSRRMIREHVGPRSAHYASALLHQALLLLRMRQAVAAEPLLESAASIQRAMGSGGFELAQTLVHLASCRAARGAVDQGFELAREALALFEADGARSGIAQTRGLLSVMHEAKGELAEAEEQARRALELQRRVHGEDHVFHAAGLSRLAGLRCRQGKLEAAEALARRALHIEEGVLGPEHPSALSTLLLMARIAAAQGREHDASAYIVRSIEAENRLLGEIFSIASEAQRMHFLLGTQDTLASFLSLVLSSGAERAIRREAFRLVLRRKALGAEALAVQRDAVRAQGDPEIKARFEALLKLRLRIADATLRGAGGGDVEAFSRQIRSWRGESERLEKELARELPELRLERQMAEVRVEQVAEAMPAGTSLIEILRFRPTAGFGHADPEPRYLAFTLSADEPESIEVVDLGTAEEIERLVAQLRGRIEASWQGHRVDWRPPARALRQRLVEPLLPALAGRRRLMIAPDSALYRLPFEVLLDDDDRHLIEDFEISYLSTARDVLRLARDRDPSPGQPLVLADPAFDLGSEGAEGPDPDAGKPFGPLPQSRVEGLEIAEMLSEELDLEISPWLGELASEGPLKASRSPWILHLATHGFFKASPASRPVRDDRSFVALGRDASPEPEMLLRAAGERRVPESSIEQQPLLRSGLALAGANGLSRGFRPPAGAEDGLLTAQDVTALRLEGTELVVLSACQTGLGDVMAGEGVFGLRRAFTLAGARTLVLSLWSVPDNATRELMTDFYRRLLAGEGRAEALRRAQRTVRRRHPHPCAWGAFICQGDPSPLPELPASLQQQPDPEQFLRAAVPDAESRDESEQQARGE